HASRRGHLGLGRARRRDHDERPRLEGRLLREPRRQELPARGVLHGVRGGAAPVSTETIHDDPHGDVSVDRVELSAELAGEGGRAATADIAEYALRLGDDALILSQQLGAWIARAPELEEDVALGNIAL